MAYHPSLPWPEIHEFLLNIEQTEDTKNLCLQAATELQHLIPFDTGYILFFDTHFQVTEHHVLNVPEKQLQQFLDYYITVDPCRQKTPPDAKAWRLDWGEFKHTEFQTDFGDSAKIHHTSSMYLHHPNQTPGAIFFATRSGSHGFSDCEYAIWEILQPHLSNHFSITEKLKRLYEPHSEDSKKDALVSGLTHDPQAFYPIELIHGHKLLSKREAEVTSLLCQRLTVPEIASKLVISPHTVRTYMENIKEKLNVKNRRELIMKLAGKK